MVAEGNIILISCGWFERRDQSSANTYAANPV